MHLAPIKDKILVERLPDESTTAGGLIIPDAHKSIGNTKRGRGYVRAIGPGDLNGDGVRFTPDVAIGDEIVFSRLTGEDAAFDAIKLEEFGELGLDPSKDYVLINECEVMMVIEDGP